MSRVSVGLRPAGAADSIRFEVRGGPALKRKLDRLANVEVKKIMRRALRNGAKVILPVARANAPVGATGAIRRGIRVRAAKRSRRYVGVVIRLGKGFFLGDEFYGAFQEFGWKAGKRRGRRKHGRSVPLIAFGRIPGKHFMQRAAERKRRQAGDVIIMSAWGQLKARALMRGGLGGGRL